MKPQWSEPRYLMEGDYVWLPVARLENGKSRVVKCKVDCAAGDMARIHELPFGDSCWYRLSELLVPPDDPRHWDYQEKKDAS